MRVNRRLRPVLEAEQITVYDDGPAVRAAADSHRPVIEGLTRKFAGANRDFGDDLEQLAHITLWELDPSRFDAGDNVYVRSQLAMAMFSAWRGDSRARKIPMDEWLRRLAMDWEHERRIRRRAVAPGGDPFSGLVMGPARSHTP